MRPNQQSRENSDIPKRLQVRNPNCRICRKNHDNIQHNMCLINMVTRESTRSQYALQAKSLHNKYIYGHNRTKMIAIHGITLGWHTRGDQSLRLVPATCRRNKSHRVNGPSLLPNLVARITFGPCDLFVKTLCVNCSWDQPLQPVPSCKLFRELVAGTSPIVCADLYNAKVNYFFITDSNLYDIQTAIVFFVFVSRAIYQKKKFFINTT